MIENTTPLDSSDNRAQPGAETISAPLEDECRVPTSFAQQRLWFINQLEPDHVAYNRPYAYRLTGALELAALQRSLDAVVARHETLRTVFEAQDGVPFQLIHEACKSTCLIRQVDLSQIPVAEREGCLQQELQAETCRLFDLARGPLLRPTLYHLAEDEHVLLLTLHHIITDGWSKGILFRELAAHYQAFGAGGGDAGDEVTGDSVAHLPELPVQYADYALWQREWLQGDRLAPHLAYWRAQLQDAPAVLDLPTRGPRPAMFSEHGALCTFELPAGLGDRLKVICRREGCTLFMLLLAAFDVLLYRTAHQEDFVVGTPIANRTRVEIEGLIGCFVNTLALRARLAGDPTFRELLARTRETCLEAYTHQDLPFAHLIDGLNLSRNLAYNPLFQVMFTLENTAGQTWSLPGLAVHEMQVHTATAMFDLKLNMTETGRGLAAEFEYNTDLFTADAIERMAGHFQRLLAEIAADPEQRISSLRMLSPAEQQRILVEWNDTNLALPDNRCIHEWFEAQVERTPDAPAVICASQSLTYRELNERANRLAHFLRHLGVGVETPVGICVERSLDTVVGILGILKAGGAYVPADPAYPPQRLAQVMAESRAPVLLTQSHLHSPAPGDQPAAYRVVCLDAGIDAGIDADADAMSIAGECGDNLPCVTTPANLAYVIYTSGSQGKPKGVMIEHHSALNLLAGLEHAIYAAHPGGPYQASLNASVAFDASVQQLLLLLRGHVLHIFPQSVRTDGAALLALIRRQRLDVLDCAPSQLKALIAAGLLDGMGWRPRIVLCGGEAIDAGLWQALSTADDMAVYNVYGPTECCVDTTICRVRAGLPPSIGKPIVNTRHYVLDANGQPLPVGGTGELYIRGAGLARGYQHQPELSAQKFMPDPFSAEPGARLYATGDMVRWLANGNLEYLGRNDQQIKMRGFRIELGEIESALMRHPGLRGAVVVMREDVPGDQRLIAYVVPQANMSAVSAADLRQFLQVTLPAFMVPAAIVFLDALPLTPNGKIDRHALPAPIGERQVAADAFILPRNALEKQLAQIWAQVLRIDASQIGIHDNFFELGGHSLLVLQAVTRIKNVLQVELLLRTFFEEATIAQLAAHIQAASTASLPSAFPSPHELPPHPAQWNDAAAHVTHGHFIHELFEQQAQLTPDATAVVYLDRSLTYRELSQRANQAASYLRKRGAGLDVIVGICVERSLEMVIGLLGILKAGAAYLPLEPALPQARLAFMLKEAGAPIILTQAHLLPFLPDTPAQLVCLDADWHAIAGEPDADPGVAVHDDSLAYAIYTSGSTGMPKGVMNTHAGIRNILQWVQSAIGLTSNDRFLHKSPFSFDVSLLEIFWPLATGACVVSARPGGHQEPDYLSALIQEQQITVAQFVPSMLQAFLDQRDLEPVRCLRKVISAGEALKSECVERFFSALDCRLYNLYGPTEAAVDVTGWVCERGGNWPVAPIGKPIANTQVVVLDSALQPVPEGEPGELYIAGVGLARGYLQRPDLTAERFIPNPFSREPGARMYASGDLVRKLTDGNLEYLGRLDHQVKIHGYRIELGEIEHVLGQHPAVHRAVVIAREDVPGDQRLVAYVVPHPDQPTTQAGLHQYLRQRLPAYMLPTPILFLRELPLTPNGKIDRRALPAPSGERQIAPNSHAAASNPLEEQLVQSWAQVLRLDASRIGIHDDFFELGGHSLLAMQVAARIHDAWNVNLRLRTFFENPTIAQLATVIQAARPVAPVQRLTPTAESPLSQSQQRLWFLEQINPGSAAYNVGLTYRLSGPLDIETLRRSLEAMVHRHDILRSTYPARNGQPCMVIHPPQPFFVNVIDLSDRPENERETSARQRVQTEAAQPFDLARGPLLRATLVRLAEREYALLLTVHHIIIDEWSMRIIQREISALYTAFAAGAPATLPALRAQYADFVAWQNARLDGDELRAQMDYWRQQLADVPPLLELPTDRPYPPLQSFHGATCDFVLPATLLAGLRSLSLGHGATLFMTMLAAFQALLQRYTSQNQFIVGTPITNRSKIEFENLLGYFLNTLALRADLSGELTFLELLGRVRNTCLDAYTNQELPFDWLVSELPVVHDLRRPPLVQVMLVLQERAWESLALPGIDVAALNPAGATAKFELTLFLRQAGDVYTGSIEYNTDIFNEDTIRRMAGHFQILLEGIVRQPGQKLSQLPLLSSAEHTTLVSDWNNTRVDYPDTQTIHELFATQAAQTPEAVALVFGDQTLTYRELDRRANQVAHALRRQGVGTEPETMVGLCVERSLEMVIGLLGILKAGGAYLPLDPANPPERLAFMLADAGAALVLTQQSLTERLPAAGIPRICLDTGWEAIGRESAEAVDNRAVPGDLAYMIYTSGSTGTPKGVCCEHRGVVRLVKGADYAHFGPEEVFLQLASISFDASTFEIWGSLLNGGRLVIMDPHTPSLQELGQAIRQHGVTTLWLTAGLFHLAVDQQLPELGRLRQLLAGGDVLSAPHVLAFLRQYPGCRLINGYGPTEGTTFTTCCLLDDAAQVGGTVPIGRPIANTQVHVLDEHLQPAPIGIPGELYIGGAGVARGYHHRPELTAQRFVPDPFAAQAGARLYRTGDQARWRADGTIEFLGRLDQQVKIRGFRVEPGEVESILAQHPAVLHAAVVVQQDVALARRLAAFVVPQPGYAPDADTLRQFLRTKLPEYMQPATLTLVETLPLTANGKLDRQALAQQVTAAQPAAGAAPAVPAVPADALEAALVDIWAQALGLDAGDVGIHDNFFELGGNSLLAMQLFFRIEQAFAQRLPIASLFQSPTIAQLAGVIRGHGQLPDWSPLVMIQYGVPDGQSARRTPFFCVHGFGGGVVGYASLAQRLGVDQAFYGLQATGLDGQAEPDADIGAMAARYIKAMRNVQPVGPYYLGGYCFGGNVAYEMACQLRAQGEGVALLAIIEGYAPARLRPRSSFWQWGRAANLWRNVPYWLQDYLNLGLLGIRRRAQRQVRKMTHAVWKRLGAGGHASAHEEPQDFVDDDLSQLPAWERQLMQAQIRALAQWSPGPYAGRVTLFRARHQTISQVLFAEDGPDLGWGKLALGGVDIRPCPGSHRNLHVEPYVAGLAAQLRQCLNDVAGVQ